MAEITVLPPASPASPASPTESPSPPAESTGPPTGPPTGPNYPDLELDPELEAELRAEPEPDYEPVEPLPPPRGRPLGSGKRQRRERHEADQEARAVGAAGAAGTADEPPDELPPPPPGGPPPPARRSRSSRRHPPPPVAPAPSSTYRPSHRPVAPPRPPFYKFDSDRPKGQRPDDFFRWWNALDAETRSQLLCYVYRTWPVIQDIDPETNHTSLQIDKVSGATPLVSTDDLLHRYGSGDYILRLNEMVVLKKTIAHCTVSGLRDMDHHPPVIHDLSKLVTTDPRNSSYIKYLQYKGVRIPGVEPLGENDEMSSTATSEAMEVLTNTIKDLSDKVVTVSTARHETPAPPPPQPAPPPLDVEAAHKGMDIVAKAATMGHEMIQTALDKVTEVSRNQADPLALFDKATAFARELQPQAAAPIDIAAITSPLTSILRQVMEEKASTNQSLFALQAARISAAEQNANDATHRVMELQSQLTQQIQTQLTALQAQFTGGGGGTGGAVVRQKTVLEQIKELKEIRETLLGDEDDGGGGGGGGGSSKSNPSWSDSLPSILQYGLLAVSMIGTIIHNMAVARSGAGTPIAPPAPPMPSDMAPVENIMRSMSGMSGMSGMPGMPGPGPGAGPGQSQPGQPGQQNQQNQQQNQPGQGRSSGQPTREQVIQTYISFLQQIERPLVACLEANETGYDFAEKLISWQGRVVYDALREQGKDVLLTVISAYPPLWQLVSQIPQRFNDFLDEFFAYDEWAAQQDEEGDGDEQGDNPGEAAATASAAGSAPNGQPLQPQPLQPQPQPQPQPAGTVESRRHQRDLRDRDLRDRRRAAPPGPTPVPTPTSGA